MFVLVMAYGYIIKMMIIVQFLLILVMLEDTGNEVECDEMN